MKKTFWQAGFTLTEMIIVVAIVAILGIILTDFLIQSLRAENKVKVLNQVKQNGQVVLDKLTNEIRYAKQILCEAQDNPVGTNTIVLVKNDGSLQRLRFFQPGVSTNGYIAVDQPDPDTVTADNACIGALSGERTLSDNDPVDGISLDYDNSDPNKPVFERKARPGSNEMVVVKFRAFHGVGGGAAYEATVKEGGILFTTTVQLRGWQ